MIERHIPFRVGEDQGADFERFFAEQYRPAALEMPGLLSIALLRLQDRPSQYRMVFRWQDAPSAVAWRVSPVHEALQPRLRELAEMGEIHVFDVVA